MSNKSENGFVLIKDRIPYHGKGVDELTGALRKILTEPANKFAQKIVLEVGTPHIYVEKLVPESEAADLPQAMTLHDAIRNAKMEEYEPDGNRTPVQQLWDIYGMLTEEKLHPIAIAIGDKVRFQKWLGIRIAASNMSLFGTPIHIAGELPEDVFVVCGASDRAADNHEIKYSVKATI